MQPLCARNDGLLVAPICHYEEQSDEVISFRGLYQVFCIKITGLIIIMEL